LSPSETTILHTRRTSSLDSSSLFRRMETSETVKSFVISEAKMASFGAPRRDRRPSKKIVGVATSLFTAPGALPAMLEMLGCPVIDCHKRAVPASTTCFLQLSPDQSLYYTGYYLSCLSVQDTSCGLCRHSTTHVCVCLSLYRKQAEKTWK
jgi:hypothetical protein